MVIFDLSSEMSTSYPLSAVQRSVGLVVYLVGNAWSCELDVDTTEWSIRQLGPCGLAREQPRPTACRQLAQGLGGLWSH